MAETGDYLAQNGLAERMDSATHIAWSTGGRLVPDEVRKEYLRTWC